MSFVCCENKLKTQRLQLLSEIVKSVLHLYYESLLLSY